jgi:CheY-like chemotaxis protein
MPRRDQTLLIIDDDQFALDAFARMLKTEGYRVHASHDPASGLEELQRVSADALLVDLHMPACDGVEVLRRVRTLPQYSRLPVAVVTGDYFMDESVARTLEQLGARIYFKPVWEDDLLRIANDLLASGR